MRFIRQDRKLVVITGVTSGLGRAMLDRFDEQNWMVAGCGRSATEIERLKQRFGERHYFEIVDVADENSVACWSERVSQFCGIPNLLINNASIINKSARTWEIPLKEFSNVIRINVMGVANVIHYFTPLFLKENAGTIINISSGWGREGDKDVSAYSGSKFAVEGMTQAMAREVPPGMAVVTLDPRDGIATPMLSLCAPADYVAGAPTPEEWSRVAVPYILSIGPEHNGKALTCPPVVKQSADAVPTTMGIPLKSSNLSQRKCNYLIPLITQELNLLDFLDQFLKADTSLKYR